MSVMPGVDYRPVSQHGGKAESPVGIVCHHIVGSLDVAEAKFNEAGSNTSAHFGVGYDGTIRQWVDTDVVAYHACQANYTGWLGVEHESPSSGDLYVPLTDAQVQATGRILRWLHETAGVPLVVVDVAHPFGVAYHSWNPGPCETHWGQTGCPGDAIIGQRQAIVDAATVAPMAGGDVYILYNPTKTQAVLVGDVQVDGFDPAQLVNVNAAVQVTARTQAEFDATLAKRTPKVVPAPPGTASANSYTIAGTLTPKV